MPKAFLIFGPESSGTRMLTEYIIRCAGAFGDWGHYQPLDRTENFNHLKPDSDIVWRRSLPHGGIWTNIPTMIQLVVSKGFTPFSIGIIRDKEKTVMSQRRHKHIKSIYQGRENYKRASELVAYYGCPLVKYEEFIASRAYRDCILRILSINPPEFEPMEIRA